MPRVAGFRVQGIGGAVEGFAVCPESLLCDSLGNDSGALGVAER